MSEHIYKLFSVTCNSLLSLKCVHVFGNICKTLLSYHFLQYFAFVEGVFQCTDFRFPHGTLICSNNYNGVIPKGGHGLIMKPLEPHRLQKGTQFPKLHTLTSLAASCGTQPGPCTTSPSGVNSRWNRTFLKPTESPSP